MNRGGQRVSRPCRASVFWIVLLTAAWLAAPAVKASAPEPVARIESASGSVLLKQRGVWGVEPRPGLALYERDKVLTQEGKVVIVLKDGKKVTIGNFANVLIVDPGN